MTPDRQTYRQAHTCLHTYDAGIHTGAKPNSQTVIHQNTYWHVYVHSYRMAVTYRQSDIHTYRQTHIQKHLQNAENTDGQAHTYRQAYIHTYRNTYIQKYIHTYTEKDRQGYIQTYRHT